jgi:hypothetical protein
MFLYGTWFSINGICMQYSSIWSSYVSHKPVSLQVEMNLVVLSIGLHIIQNSFLRPNGTFKCSLWDFEISCDTYIPVYYHVSLERFIRFAQKNGCNIYLKPLGDECGRNIYNNKCNTSGNLLTVSIQVGLLVLGGSGKLYSVIPLHCLQNMFLYGTWFSINGICMQYSSIWSSYVSHKPVSLQVEMNLVVLSIGL